MQGFPKLQIPRPPGGPGGVRLLSVGVTTAIGAVAFYKYALFNGKRSERASSEYWKLRSDQRN